MTQPSSGRPVPGPPRPGPSTGSRPGEIPRPGGPGGAQGPQEAGSAGDPFADFVDRPVAEHVGVFEEEHSRLQRELGTIDQL